jgi:hypothetical protein
MRDAARPLGSVPWRVAMAWRYQRAAVRTCPRAAATAADIKLVITFPKPGCPGSARGSAARSDRPGPAGRPGAAPAGN